MLTRVDSMRVCRVSILHAKIKAHSHCTEPGPGQGQGAPGMGAGPEKWV